MDPMNRRHYLAPCLVLFTAVAHAHVTLPSGGAAAGSVYPAAFRVGHACKDAKATTALKVTVPDGFTPIEVPARPGWKITRTPTTVSWTAESPAAAIPAAAKTSFDLRGRLTDKPGTLWFKVEQACDNGRADWTQIPSNATDKPEFPAARLDVLPPGMAPVDVRDAWARPTVPGQMNAGVYARLMAPAGARLVGGSSPLAGAVEVHEMKMEGDVMRMRPLDALDLPPAQAVELRPGAQHIMLLQLKQALPLGSSVPLTLRFVDREGRESALQLSVPVAQPAGAGAMEHAH
jgi:periplasmic copper chaperone A